MSERQKQRNRKSARESARKSRRKLKMRIVLWYSPTGVCQCDGEDCWHKGPCSVSDLDVLSADHINGGGNAHRRKVGFGHNFYLWLEAHHYPDGFRVFCMNCQRKRQHRDHQWGNRWK